MSTSCAADCLRFVVQHGHRTNSASGCRCRMLENSSMKLFEAGAAGRCRARTVIAPGWNRGKQPDRGGDQRFGDSRATLAKVACWTDSRERVHDAHTVRTGHVRTDRTAEARRPASPPVRPFPLVAGAHRAALVQHRCRSTSGRPRSFRNSLIPASKIRSSAPFYGAIGTACCSVSRFTPLQKRRSNASVPGSRGEWTSPCEYRRPRPRETSSSRHHRLHDQRAW